MIATKKNKEEFVKYTNARIEHNKMLLDFYTNVFNPIVKKFDGKVYNIRFIKALREEAARISDLLFVKELQTICHDDNVIEVFCKIDKFNYLDGESIYCKLMFNEQGRICYEKTKDNKQSKDWYKAVEDRITDYQNVIDNYDEYMKITEQMDNAIQQYRKISYIFRSNIDTKWYI